MKITKVLFIILTISSLTNCSEKELKYQDSIVVGFLNSPLVYAGLYTLLYKPNISNDAKIALGSYACAMTIVNYLNVAHAKTQNIAMKKIALCKVLGMSLGTTLITLVKILAES